MFIRYFEDSDYEESEWILVWLIETAVFCVITANAPYFASLDKTLLAGALSDRLHQLGFPHPRLNHARAEAFLANFLRSNSEGIRRMLADVPPGRPSAEFAVKCHDRERILTCLRSSESFARETQLSWWKERQIEAELG